MEPSKKFELDPRQLFRLMKPLYGLSNSSDRLYHTLKQHHLDELRLLSTTGDLSLYIKHVCHRLIGLCGVHVDDVLQTGDASFKELTELTGRRFDATPRRFRKSKFMGMHIDQDTDRKKFQVSMSAYIDNLQLIRVPCTFTEYRSMRSQLAWTMNCHPDFACAVAQSAQVIEEIFDPAEDAKGLNRITRHLKKHNLRTKFPHLDRKSLHTIAYSDASHANNRDLSSQLGIVIALCDKKNRCAIVGYRSYKYQRVTRSAIALECHALADVFDYAYLLKTHI